MHNLGVTRWDSVRSPVQPIQPDSQWHFRALFSFNAITLEIDIVLKDVDIAPFTKPSALRRGYTFHKKVNCGIAPDIGAEILKF